MPLGGIENLFVGKMHGACEAPGMVAQTRLWLSKKRSGMILLAFEAMLCNGLDGQCAGDFSMGLAAHAIGQDEELQRCDDAKAIFVVRAKATYVAYAAAYDFH
jgi:hypothetical protein